MDSNPSQPLVSTRVDTRMHKEEQQATGDLTSLGVTSEARANPQLSSGMLAFNLNEPIYSTSFIIPFESASGNDASAASTAEADLGKSAPSDFIPQQQGMNEAKKITLKKGSSIARQVEEEEASSTIKLEDLAKLVSNVQPSFKDLDSPEDDPVIIVDNDKDKEDEVHTTTNDETKDTSVPKSSSPRSSHIQELTNQVNELLVKSLRTEFSNILFAHDFSSSLPTELKDLPSKFVKLNEEVKGFKKQVYELKIELPGDLKDIPSKLKDFTKTVTSLTLQVAKLKTLQWELPAEFLSLPVPFALVQAKLKTMDVLLGLLLNVTKALNKFSQVFDSASSKAGDQGVPSAGQADTMPAKGENNTNQATIS
ncbi:hypothetical protein Tco_0705171 [Tanacetum coccineum]|uniref:Uncharacterized protein n=1 Tax=Tanacetum coccineum TaxID=301880 RepID=A0ABQ4Y3T3_9ASTR